MAGMWQMNQGKLMWGLGFSMFCRYKPDYICMVEASTLSIFIFLMYMYEQEEIVWFM